MNHMTTDPTATGEGYEDDNNYGSDLSDDLDDLEGGEELRIDQQTSWLIKLPDYLAEKWSKVDKSNTFLGNVQIERDEQGGLKNFKLIIPDAEENAHTYDVIVKDPDVKGTFVFEETEDGVARRIASKVVHEVHAKAAASDDALMRLLKYQQQQKRAKRTVMLDEGLENHNYLNPSYADRTETFNAAKRPKIALDQKAIRMDKADLIKLLFHCYERYQYWTLNGIVKVTRQPRNFVKEVLIEIADYVQKGAYHGTYQLKDHFMQNSNATRNGLRNGEDEDEEGGGGGGGVSEDEDDRHRDAESEEDDFDLDE